MRPTTSERAKLLHLQCEGTLHVVTRRLRRLELLINLVLLPLEFLVHRLDRLQHFRRVELVLRVLGLPRRVLELISTSQTKVVDQTDSSDEDAPKTSSSRGAQATKERNAACYRNHDTEPGAAREGPKASAQR